MSGRTIGITAVILQWFILSLFISFLKMDLFTIRNELLCSKLHPKLASSCKNRKCQCCKVNRTDLCEWNHLQSDGEAHFFHFSCRFCPCRPSPGRLMIKCHTPPSCVRINFVCLPSFAFFKDEVLSLHKRWVFQSVLANYVQFCTEKQCNWATLMPVLPTMRLSFSHENGLFISLLFARAP